MIDPATALPTDQAWQRFETLALPVLGRDGPQAPPDRSAGLP
ncbi:hypothetical protein [Nocardia sp. SSK8]